MILYYDVLNSHAYHNGHTHAFVIAIATAADDFNIAYVNSKWE